MTFKARETARPIPLPEVRDDDRFAYPDDEPRSQFTAFLMGGVVVAGGLLAFLYYDSNGLDPNMGREPITTGSIVQAETLARVPSIEVAPPAPAPLRAD
jgi:hypothetical protein